MAVERKYERDLDLLLAEELAVSPAFADWFRSRTKFSKRAAAVVDVFVSRADNLGESDLIVLFEADHGGRFALMIEDKVDAPLQPEQALRYRLRADREIAAGFFQDFETVLCAPRSYIGDRSDLSDFDHLICLEDIAEFLTANDGSPRGRYRAQFLSTAATRRANSWAREQDATTDAFWDAAYQLASAEFPILEMKPLAVTKGSTWINFRPRDLPTKPKRTYVSLKGDRGQIDLTFSNTTAHRFAEMISDRLGVGMTVHQTAASSAIRLTTQGFRPDEPIESGMIAVRQAFEASRRLIEFYRENRTDLDDAAASATPVQPIGRGRG